MLLMKLLRLPYMVVVDLDTVADDDTHLQGSVTLVDTLPIPTRSSYKLFQRRMHVQELGELKHISGRLCYVVYADAILQPCHCQLVNPRRLQAAPDGSLNVCTC